MPSVQVYGLDLSPPVRAVKMVCDILKVPVEMKAVDFQNGGHRSPEYLKLNPLHTMPVIVDGDIVLHDSHAILMYLVDVYGNNDTLYPKDVKQRALVNQKLFFNNSYLFPRMRNVTYPIFVEGAKGVQKKQLEDIEEVYEFLEEFLSRSKYIAGDNITIADIAAFPTVCGLNYILPVDNERFPRINAWIKELENQSYTKKHNEGPAKELGQLILQAIK